MSMRFAYGQFFGLAVLFMVVTIREFWLATAIAAPLMLAWAWTLSTWRRIGALTDPEDD